MPPEDILYEVDGSIAVVTLNRPKYRNAQSWPMLRDLLLAETDPRHRTILLK